MSSLPYIDEFFLSPFECGCVIETIKHHTSSSIYNSSRERAGERTLIPVRFLYGHGLQEAAALADNIRRRCVQAAVNALQPDYNVWPDYMMYQANFPGDFHPRHSDNSKFNQETKSWEPNHTPHRKITIGVYLNECGIDYEGGELCFPAQNIKLKPKAGTFLCYFSDERFEHEVMEVTNGERYSILLWLTDNEAFAESVIFPPAGPI